MAMNQWFSFAVGVFVVVFSWIITSLLFTTFWVMSFWHVITS
jgi:hypothetical protein